MRRLRDSLANGCYRILLKWAPYDTGELSQSIRITNTEDGFHIEIPTWYTVYTNEPWINRSGVNPNQNWIDNAVAEMYEFIRVRLTGGKWNMAYYDNEHVYAIDEHMGE